MVGFLLGLLLVAGFAWYLVFNEQARRKFGEPRWVFRRSKEGREVDDAINLAASLIIAVFCSTIFVGILIIALIQAFK